MSDVLAVFANVTSVLTILMYLQQVRQEKSKPNPASVLIWVITMWINAISYGDMTQWSILKTAVPVSTACGMSAVFFYSWYKDRFTAVEWSEIATLSIAGLLGIYYFLMGGDPELVNPLLQVAIFLGYWPYARGLVWGAGKDAPLAWAMGTLIYALQLGAVTTSPNGCTWPELAFLVVNGLLGNGAILAIAMWKDGWKKK